MEALGDDKQARILREESLALFRQLGDVTGIAYSLINLGIGALNQNDHTQATAYLKESLALFHQLKEAIK